MQLSSTSLCIVICKSRFSLFLGTDLNVDLPFINLNKSNYELFWLRIGFSCKSCN